MNEIGLVSPSSNTAALRTFGSWPIGGGTTTPFLLLCLEAAAEVSKTVVTAVPGSTVGTFECDNVINIERTSTYIEPSSSRGHVTGTAHPHQCFSSRFMMDR